MKKCLLLLAIATGSLSAPAQAVTYTYVGKWEVDDLSWEAASDHYSHNPLSFTGQEAAAYLFGGSFADYAISTKGIDASQIDFSNWVTSWGCGLCVGGNSGTVVAQNFKIGSVNPNDSGTTVVGGTYYAYPNSSSALLQDWAIGPRFTNYAFRIDDTAAVPEPATWATMLVGMAAIGFAMRRQRQQPKVRFAF